jgi:hypothetical protein
MSPVAREQLLLVAADGIDETEMQLMSEFDALMRDFGPSPQDSIIIGMCLRRLSLYYRRRMRRYKLISGGKFAKYAHAEVFLFPKLYAADVKIRKEKSKAMYEALTTGYSMVYRGQSSPYSPEWRLEDHREALGNNKDLIESFKKITIAEKDFCKFQIINIQASGSSRKLTLNIQGSRKLDDEDDLHFRKLFLERRERKGPRPSVRKS